MCVGWPWAGATVDPFVLPEGEQAAKQGDPLSEQHRGSCHPLIVLNLPPQHATSSTCCLGPLPYSLLGNPKSNKGSYSLGLPPIFPVLSLAPALHLGSMSGTELSHPVLQDPFSPVPPHALLQHFFRYLGRVQYSPEESRFGSRTQEAHSREHPWMG